MELYHHGVKGQKWGVRNDDTSLASKRKGQDANGIVGVFQRGSRAGGSIKMKNTKEYKAEMAKKQKLDQFKKNFANSYSGQGEVTRAAASKFTKEEYEMASNLIAQGRLLINASYKSNYKENCLDLFLNDLDTPTMKIRA